MENLYSQVKIFHYRERLDALEQGRALPPLHVRLKPINACNHRCSYCCYRSDSLFLGELLSEKDSIPRAKMLEMAADMIEVGVRAVTFTGGGEPLIYPHFAEAASRLLEGGVKVATLTNGSALRGEAADVLAAGASWVRVSMDSLDGPSIARSRGLKPEEFDRIIENLRAFAKRKHADCELGINFILTADNAHRVYEFFRLMKETGADHVKVSGCVVGTTARENNDYHAPHFRMAAEGIARAAAELADASFKVVDKFHEMDGQYAKTYDYCPFVSVFLNVIGADQNVYTCQDKAYTRSGLLGSVRDRSLKEFWLSEEYARAVRGVRPCDACAHHCVQHGKNLALLDYLGTDRRHLDFV
ncbi:GTP 3',8-cyclase 1 [Fundidesulfovibrio magnetotacticus]|uniref:GTP 3',8-cyclase 1 n=1 Tax=Fundidesulfovibrio magnetotacticus TaxID=2730080 RepID=A0A6V8LXH4_9BACT|nr:radical SAM protein [Fundidesulfovibrio magnetotacticus]GFK94958.1 GTP 3',8-cyclase 1 [Fundidesulfovibrio magnetotacticus]